MSISLGIRRACMNYEIETGERLVQIVLTHDDFRRLLAEVKTALHIRDAEGRVACVQIGDCLVTAR